MGICTKAIFSTFFFRYDIGILSQHNVQIIIVFNISITLVNKNMRQIAVSLFHNDYLLFPRNPP